ncbi:uncharacterized protein F5891DRAFT_1209847 [Suillus fuscotomentosus]|uniref:Uncharacterized protein n=1 Tax=Suillus fuscotomentosus TaxID=1912939 RepID=A0AAD4HCP2_9AGAM|nr:uncharacterized protein F5891DRAFT_1209847 [Suillus fuscotomentosus]KAG1891855.1 hypothetical protein F5891DRAFT_1209847 [Suillus fuscotomentosus]
MSLRQKLAARGFCYQLMARPLFLLANQEEDGRYFNTLPAPLISPTARLIRLLWPDLHPGSATGRRLGDYKHEEFWSPSMVYSPTSLALPPPPLDSRTLMWTRSQLFSDLVHANTSTSRVWDCFCMGPNAFFQIAAACLKERAGRMLQGNSYKRAASSVQDVWLQAARLYVDMPFVHPQLRSAMKQLETSERARAFLHQASMALSDAISNLDEISARKGKDADIARWEAELRKSLANKKGGATATPSKQAQALVQAQLDKEEIVRQRVATIKLNLQRGLSYIQSLASINVPELRMYVSFILSLLLEGAMGQGSRLVGSQAFETWTSPSAAQHVWILSISALLKGRVDAGQDDGDEALEQVTLVLDIIRFHCSEFSDAAFPRKATMEYVLQVIKHQPRLSKEASSVLIDLGEAVQPNATRDEVGVLMDGTLLQEVYVRNARLQAIQPFDLTDLDWSPQHWVACHDDDEQNVRLAKHLWEDNGLDVPEDFLDKLMNYLEHNNAYVRTSAVSAIAEAVIYWPRKSALTIAALQDFCREKAKILAPEFDEYVSTILNFPNVILIRCTGHDYCF